MARNANALLAEMRDLMSAVEASAGLGDARSLRTNLKALGAWIRERIIHAPSPAKRVVEENEDLRQRLRVSKGGFDAMVTSYKALLDTFETFRGTIDLVQQVKRLEDLPAILESIRTLRSLHTLHLVLDRDIFEDRIPDDIGHAPARIIRERIRQFSPTPHAPRLFLGEVGRIENPGFFLGLEHDPPQGSCFIFALGHKYQQGKTIGIVSAYDPDPERYAPDKATDFLGHFCDILACTLITALEHAQLEELTVRDALTGVNNRAYLERHAPRILDFAVRKGLPVHLLFIDLNGFKAVNDTLGHEAGDLVLVGVARAIRGMVRKYDIFVRMGGDEFVILLPGTDAAMAACFVQRLRETLDEIDVSDLCGMDTRLGISASVGVSRHRPNQSLDELIRAADLRMYEEKNLPRAHNHQPCPDGGHAARPAGTTEP
ncbi:GGDEF domain-containing protein [Desulfomicrobium salsuginis]